MSIWLIITGIIVILAGLVIFLIQKRKKDMNKMLEANRNLADKIKNASFANATIIQVESGMAGGQSGKARINLTLKVLDETPYIARTNWFVDITELDYLKAGNEISIKIDRENPKLIYPNASWARYISTY